MKKQFTKIKIAAENLSRSSKHDRKDFELETIEKQVDKYRDVLEKMVRKMPAVTSTTDAQERDKRIKKNSHYKTGQALEESSKELSKDMPLCHVLANCGELEKSIAECIVDSELETETEVVRRLRQILDNEIQEISTHKRNVSRTLQEYTSLKRNYEAAIRLEEPLSKINHIKEQQEQCEVKLEKERDQWAAQMFELIAKEDVIVQCIRDYVLNQRNYHERALKKVNSSLAGIEDIIHSTVKSRFGTSLSEHLKNAKRQISYILELCICCLVEHGLYEEGLLRVGCASTKLRRMKHALEAQYVKTPLPLEYQDPHVIGSILKLYLRELPEPLLTFQHYKEFIKAAECHSEADRMAAIRSVLEKIPKENYDNLRYLTKFLWLVTQHSEQNKMTSQNLAIVLSPNMLWPRVDKSNPTDYLGQVNSSSAVNVIVELLISQWDYFFSGEVDFFVTLQRGKLFVEGKSKSNSSNEHIDRHDSEDHQRYGTIKRQKPFAPTPPVNKAGTVADERKNGEVSHHRSVKELFPASSNNNNNNNNNHSTNSTEKPEKPPLPKLPQIQMTPSATNTVTSLDQDQSSQSNSPAKPVPMTRTQFFGLDKLPSPVADRRSTDSLGSFGMKPDLPQKPKIPKRPVVLGLNAQGAGNGGSKSDDEGVTSTVSNGSNTGADANFSKSSTERLIEQLRRENHEATAVSTTGSVTTTKAKELNENLSIIEAEKNTNANALSGRTTGASVSSNANNNAASDAGEKAPLESNHTTQAQVQRQTPTTPVSPNMILTPKRPTVPAPPPPSVVKKQAD